MSAGNPEGERDRDAQSETNADGPTLERPESVDKVRTSPADQADEDRPLDKEAAPSGIHGPEASADLMTRVVGDELVRHALESSRASTAEVTRLANEARRAVSSEEEGGAPDEDEVYTTFRATGPPPADAPPAFRVVALEPTSTPGGPEPEPSTFQLVVKTQNRARRFEESVARLAEVEAAASQAVQDKLELQLAESIRLREALESGQAESKRSTRTLNWLTFVLVVLTALAAIGATPVIIDAIRWVGVAR